LTAERLLIGLLVFSALLAFLIAVNEEAEAVE
jgi:hypothetical protein